MEFGVPFLRTVLDEQVFGGCIMHKDEYSRVTSSSTASPSLLTLSQNITPATMDMSMSISATTSSGMNIAMSTSSSDPSSASMTSMASMTMVFFTSTSTPLWTTAWTPTSTGQYAGTCIFLIAFAALFRGLLAIRVRVFELLAAWRVRRRGSFGYTSAGAGLRSGQAVDEMEGKSVAHGSEGSVGGGRGSGRSRRQWKASDAVIVAGLDVVLAGISYLLMLAVMTFNVGYFLSVLAGVFVGSLAFGHFLSHSAAH